MSATSLLRWTARIGSLVSVGFILAFAFGGQESGIPTLSEAIALGFFPVGIVIGFLVAWFSEGIGGGIVVLSLAAFYGWMYGLDHRIPQGPYFLLFAAPGFLFLITWLVDHFTNPSLIKEVTHPSEVQAL